MSDEEDRQDRKRREWREAQWDLFLEDHARLRARGITLDIAVDKIGDLQKDLFDHTSKDERYQAKAERFHEELSRDLGVLARDLGSIVRRVDKLDLRMDNAEEKLESGEEKIEKLSEKSGQWELDILEKERDAALTKAAELQRAIESRNSKRPSDHVESKKFWFEVAKWVAGGISAMLVQAGLMKAAWEIGARLFHP